MIIRLPISYGLHYFRVRDSALLVINVLVLTLSIVGDGAVALSAEEVEMFQLPDSVAATEPGSSLYLIAGFHQLHCLVSFPFSILPLFLVSLFIAFADNS